MAFLSLARGELVYHASMPVLRASLSNQTCGLKLATTYSHTSYDDLGNRTSMDTDGVSEVTYTYDSLSRLTSETIDFDDISTDYTITYSYDPDGSLKTLTEPFGGSFEYVRDKKGRLTDLNGTAFGGNMSGEYLTDVKYRAFGKVKEAQQSGLEISTQYDERLRISQNQVYNGSTYLLKAEYEYYADSQISHTDNQVNDLLDQWYQYDYAGRLSYNNFGSTQNSNDETITTYTQALYYNGFSEMTDRDSTTWNVQSTFGRAMTNGRLTAIGNEVLDYDASGNILRQEPNDENWQASVFDAAGRKVSHEEKWRRGGPISGQPLVKYHGESTILYDGDGRSVRQEWEKEFIQNGTPSGYSTSSRSIHSTVLGSEIASIEDVPYGERRTTNVFAGGAVIAEQLRWTPTGQSTSELYYWMVSDPITGSRIKGGVQEDFEPLGQKIDPIPPLDDPTFPGPSDGYNDARFSEWQCKVSEKFNHSYNEMPAHCQKAYNADVWAKIYAIWPAWKEKEGNLSKLVDSPILNWSGGASVVNSLARRSMAYAMSSTTKDDGPYDGGHLGTVEAEPYEEPLVVMPDISGYVDVSISSFEERDYSTKDCSKKVIDFLTSFASKELGTLDPNAATYIDPLLSYMQDWSASVTEVTFSIANSYHETQLFSAWVEPISRLSKNYDGGDDFRGRGYIHLTGKGTYKDIRDHMSNNYQRFHLSIIPMLVSRPDSASNISNALSIQTAYFDLKGTFQALSSGDYLKARKTINPRENINSKIGPKPKKGQKDTRPTIRQRIHGLTSGLEAILKGC